MPFLLTMIPIDSNNTGTSPDTTIVIEMRIFSRHFLYNHVDTPASTRTLRIIIDEIVAWSRQCRQRETKTISASMRALRRWFEAAIFRR
jgi:hypothetical protein